ncbi:complement factor H-like isoform X2 [Conger conger]|uniref:complement factor H-like isoform X2 n=1 Tax=Conger conger TaxID=82655 RepID=UPI002A5A3CB1|nr:complement factor H-like isoform X2 [Conger conger]
MQTVSYGFFLISWICFSAVAKAQKGCSGSSIPKNLKTELPSEMKDIYAHGDPLRLTCQTGYAGFLRIICTNGDWTIIRTRKCEPKQCGHPGDTPHGDFILTKGDDFVFGSQVEYTCEKGYILAGKVNHRSCMDQGWDNAIPVCEVVKCSPIPQSRYLSTSGNIESPQYGDVIQFDCETDKEKRVGEKQIHCTETGEWSANVPTCEDVTCKLPDIINGRVTNEKNIYEKDDILLFACNEGYTPVGRASSTCTQHDWMPKPQCEETVCRARTSTNITPKKTVFIPGESAKIVCEPPSRTHTKKREDTVTCRNDGSWSFSIECEETICTITPEDNILYLSYWRYTFKYKQTLSSYTCRRGFKTSGGSTCEVEGWVPPLCPAITCNPEIPNAIILSENKTYTFDERLEYECKLFHGPEGKQYAYCGVNGWQWPNCKAKENYCKRPDLENGYHINVKRDASVIYYSCVSGYKPFMEGWWDKLTCKKMEWSNIPKCIDETACVPPTILNTKEEVRKDLYSNGESLTFECEDAYEMEGTGQIKCVNGEWKSQLPVCKPSGYSCNPPPRVADATITSKYKTKYPHQSTVQFQCRDLYEIQGNREVTCTSGTWSDIPTCISKTKSTATERPSEKSGNGPTVAPSSAETICRITPEDNVQSSHYWHSTFQYKQTLSSYTCRRGFKTSGGSTCEVEGWVPPLCPAITCNPEIPNAIILSENKTYKLNEYVEYECKLFHEPEGKQNAYCGVNGWEWPNCKAKENYCKRPDLENGYHINVKSNASVIYYSCVSGYKPFVEGWWDELTCKKSEWSDIPKCIDETACVPPKILNAKQVRKVRKDLYSNGESLTFECEDAYEMEGTGQIKCVNGEWDSPLPVCKPSGYSCNPPPRVADATITSKYKTKYAHQSTVQFQCRDLYEIQGNREVTCTSGTWSDIPTCISKIKSTATGWSKQSGPTIVTPSPGFTSCEPPQEIPFGDIKGLTKDVYNTGETVEYQCKNYYVLSGREFITCRSGEWDDPPKCLEPCTVTIEEMNQRGIELRYKHPTKVYVKHEERIVFACKYGKRQTDGEFINWCTHGRIHLPSCA